MAARKKAREKILRNGLTAAYLRKILDYRPLTGVLRWKHRDDIAWYVNKKMVGKVAGSQSNTGSITIGINNIQYQAHCIIWFMVHGLPAKNDIDHRNGIRNDNRIKNLRPATHAENLRNMKLRSTSSSGLKGIRFHWQRGTWQARITVNYKRSSLGYFKTKELAHEAYCKAAQKLHGAFARFE